MSKSAFRPCVNGHAEEEEQMQSETRERVVILDAGAQYGKVG